MKVSNFSVFVLVLFESVVTFYIALGTRRLIVISCIMFHLFIGIMVRHDNHYLKIWTCGTIGHFLLRDVFSFFSIVEARHSIFIQTVMHMRLVVHYIHLDFLLIVRHYFEKEFDHESQIIHEIPRNDTSYKTIFILLIMYHLLLYVPNATNQPMNIGNISMLNLAGNVIYSAIIFQSTTDFYLAMCCYFLYWIDALDLIVTLIITILIVLIAPPQTSSQPHKIDHPLIEQVVTTPYTDFYEDTGLILRKSKITKYYK